MITVLVVSGAGALGPGTATAAPAASTAAARSACPLPPEGTFVRLPNREVYQVVGGAYVYVQRWEDVGFRTTTPPVRAVSCVTRNVVRDGTFVRTSWGRDVYRFAGGVPLYVSTWAPFGGPKPAAIIGDTNLVHGLDRAYATGKWAAVRGWFEHSTTVGALGTGAVPLPTWVLRDPSTSRVYVVVAGRPVYVTSWAVFPGARPRIVDVDPRTVRLHDVRGWPRVGTPPPLLTEGTWVVGYKRPPSQGERPTMTAFRYQGRTWVEQPELPWRMDPPVDPSTPVWIADTRGLRGTL